jgi:integrase
MKQQEAAELWESVYLTVGDIEELLQHVRGRGLPFVYPMIVFAAHTGARRSEIMRCKIRDIDMKNRWVTLHERKKSHDKKTTRQVPISAKLHAVLREWLADHPGGEFLFCHGSEVARSKKRSVTTGHQWKDRAKNLKGRLHTVAPRLTVPNSTALTRDEMHDHFKRALADSKWEKLKGFHVLRHSFISCLAASGCDQRVIDDFVGHTTEEQRRRYRHLFPGVTQKAIAAVFG